MTVNTLGLGCNKSSMHQYSRLSISTRNLNYLSSPIPKVLWWGGVVKFKIPKIRYGKILKMGHVTLTVPIKGVLSSQI